VFGIILYALTEGYGLTCRAADEVGARFWRDGKEVLHKLRDRRNRRA